jgi:hypothetical protein
VLFSRSVEIPIDAGRSFRRDAESVDNQYFVGSFSPLGHSINSYSSGRGSWRHSSRRAARTRAKREDRVSAELSRHSMVRQARLGRPERKLFNRDRPMLGVAPQALCWPGAAGPWLRRQRSGLVRPHRRVRQNARDVGQPQARDVGAQIAVIAITGVHERHTTRQTGRAGLDARSQAKPSRAPWPKRARPTTPFTDKMPKRLMLGSHPRRGRHRRDRLDALALTSQHQSLCPITLASPSTYAANRDSLLLNPRRSILSLHPADMNLAQYLIPGYRYRDFLTR